MAEVILAGVGCEMSKLLLERDPQTKGNQRSALRSPSGEGYSQRLADLREFRICPPPNSQAPRRFEQHTQRRTFFHLKPAL
jgi:hypothetical protein